MSDPSVALKLQSVASCLCGYWEPNSCPLLLKHVLHKTVQALLPKAKAPAEGGGLILCHEAGKSEGHS